MSNKSRLLVILNTITLVIMLFANYAGNTGFYSKVNVADISHKYDTLFAPAGYAFIIWGVLFLMGTGFVIYQWILIKQKFILIKVFKLVQHNHILYVLCIGFFLCLFSIDLGTLFYEQCWNYSKCKHSKSKKLFCCSL